MNKRTFDGIEKTDEYKEHLEGIAEIGE